MTSELRDTPLFRIQVNPDESNGLPQVMADKVQTISREKIGDVFGHLAEEEMLAVSRALAVILGVV